MRKKIFVITTIINFILVAILVFFICANTDKMVAIKSRSVISYLDGKEMKYKDEREFYFKKDKISKIVVKYNYEDIQDSDKMYNEYKGIMQTLIQNYNLDMEIKQNKEKIVMKFDVESYKEFFGEDYSSINKENLKQTLQQEGFKT